MTTGLSFVVLPILPPVLIAAFTVLAAVLAILRPGSAPATALRLLVIAGAALYLCNPQWVTERRDTPPKTVAVVIDRSPSAQLGVRKEQIDRATAHLRAAFAKIPGLTPVFIDTAAGTSRSDLFTVLKTAMSGLPVDTRGGAILVTDGLIHDLPLQAITRNEFGPVHTLVAGSSRDFDMRLTLVAAPTYAMAGQNITATVRVDVDGRDNTTTYPITIRQGSKTLQTMLARADQDINITLPIEQVGSNTFIFEVPVQDGELTAGNNKLPLVVRGIRDRLRVLLVSAEPYLGGRMWRNTLTSDPGIDLIHFTILRSPTNVDPTLTTDLSLIPFPFEDLFERKLNEFDLVILDRYRANLIMPNVYLDNIAAYVRRGGGLLEISDYTYGGSDSITKTAIGDILPTVPDGPHRVVSFRPSLSSSGRAHPITADLTRTDINKWGRWLAYSPARLQTGTSLLLGPDQRPLLSVQRVDNGRVAQLSSDQLWLWARGYEGGGPYHELLRPLIHWLLKEPELEEDALKVSVDNLTVTIERRSLEKTVPAVTMTAPDGTRTAIDLNQSHDGMGTAQITLPAPGIYQFNSQQQEQVVAVGGLDQPEWQRLVSDADAPRAAFRKTGATVIRLEDSPAPELRLTSATRAGGRDWIGFAPPRATRVVGVQTRDMFPAWAWMIGLLAGFIGVWLMDSRTTRLRT